MAKIGLQLYSIKEIAEKDFFGAIRLAAECGYKGVEFAGFFESSAADVKKILDSEGLKACGSHTSIDLLENDFENTAEYNLAIGNKYIVIPAIPRDMYGSRDAWLRTAEKLNGLSEKLRERGLMLGYHNHAYEFEDIEGEYGYDILAKATSRDILLEIDTYWVAWPGLDVAEYVRKYKDRLELIHIKDMDEKRNSTEAGSGTIDFRTIVKDAKMTEWFIVEQEHFSMPQEDSIRKSCSYLKGIIV
ncbi:MAG: sugar phosphate isomerase/epimerase [Clostridia bacterium]|nr:sugar phosphate isomerase/epimerase [Clostridia bacterium]